MSLERVLGAGEMHKAMMMIEAGDDVNQFDFSSPLEVVIRFINEGKFSDVIYQVLDALLKAGADPNLKNRYNNGPLYYVDLKYSNLPVIKTLLAAGADINQTSSDNSTLLFKIRDWTDDDTVRYLLERGADADIINNSGVEALQWAAFGDPNAEVLTQLVYGKKTLRPNVMEWIRERFPQYLPIILKAFETKNLDPNNYNRLLQTNLMWAASNEESLLVRAYLSNAEKIVDVNWRDVFGNTALHYAFTSENPYILKELIEAGADLDLPNHQGNTPRDYLLASKNPLLENVLYL